MYDYPDHTPAPEDTREPLREDLPVVHRKVLDYHMALSGALRCLESGCATCAIKTLKRALEREYDTD